MRTAFLAAIGTIVLATACLAETFELKDDKTSKAYGPFEFKDGSKVAIGNASYTLVKSNPASAVEDKMKAIIIPKLDFRQANIHDVVRFLQDSSAEFDTSNSAEGKRGVALILNLKEKEAPLITFRARTISLFEAIRIVSDVGGLKYQIDGNVVVIEPSE